MRSLLPTFFASAVLVVWPAAVPVFAEQPSEQAVELIPASDTLNREVQALFRKAFSNIMAPEADTLFTGPIICGPYLWDDLKQEAEAQVLSKLFNPFAVPQYDGGRLTGYQMMSAPILQSAQDNAIFRALLKRRLRLRPDFAVRRLSAEELSRLWSLAAWKLSEPLFALDDGSTILIVNAVKEGPNWPMFWIDDFSPVAVAKKPGQFYQTTDRQAALADFMKRNNIVLPQQKTGEDSAPVTGTATHAP